MIIIIIEKHVCITEYNNGSICIVYSICKWKSLSHVQLCDHMDYIIHGILQARILEWIAFSFSRGSSQPRYRTQVSCKAGRFFTSWATREAQYQSGLAYPFSRGSSWLRNQTRVFCIAGTFFTNWAIREAYSI